MTQKEEIINRHLKKGWVGESGLIEMISECMEEYATLHTPTEEELRKEAEALGQQYYDSIPGYLKRVFNKSLTECSFADGYIAGKASQSNKTNI